MSQLGRALLPLLTLIPSFAFAISPERRIEVFDEVVESTEMDPDLRSEASGCFQGTRVAYQSRTDFGGPVDDTLLREIAQNDIRLCLAMAKGQLETRREREAREKASEADAEARRQASAESHAAEPCPHCGQSVKEATVRVRTADGDREWGVEEYRIAKAEALKREESARQAAERPARELMQKDPTVWRDFISWFACWKCADFEQRGRAIIKREYDMAKLGGVLNKAKVYEGQQVVGAGKQCQQEVQKAVDQQKMGHLLACGSKPAIAVGKCLEASGDEPSREPRCRAFELLLEKMPGDEHFFDL